MKQLKRAAREWNIPAKELALLCEQQKIPGAVLARGRGNPCGKAVLIVK